MEESKTKWDRFQDRFKNSWLGIVILGLVALAIYAGQVSGSVNEVLSWFRPTPRADLLVQEMPVEPLEKFSTSFVPAGADTIYPVGATVSFDLRHNRASEEEIRINSIAVVVESYDAQAACPFKLVGDQIYGAGTGAIRVFTVLMANGTVEAVQRKEERNGPIMRGRSTNLLDIDPPLPITLQRAEAASVETIKVTFLLADRGQYRMHLLTRYTTNEGPKVAQLKPVTICKPGE